MLRCDTTPGSHYWGIGSTFSMDIHPGTDDRSTRVRELTAEEIQQVSGGLNPLILLGVAGSMFAFGYSVGVDLAEYDNETMG